MRSNPEWTPKELAHATVMRLIELSITHAYGRGLLDGLNNSDRIAVQKQMRRLHNKLGDQAKLDYQEL